MARNGEEGDFTALKRSAGYYALIAISRMPVGGRLHGHQVAIRRLKRLMPAHLITLRRQMHFAEDVAACMEAGMTLIFPNPDMVIVQETIQSFTHKNA